MKTVFLNGKIWSPDPDSGQDRFCSAMVIEDGIIRYVGSAEQACQMIDDRTEVVQLDNQVVLPGFANCHGHMSFHAEHLFAGSLYQMHPGEQDTPEVFTGKCMDALSDYLSGNPARSLIRLCGWSTKPYNGQFPTRFDIDAVCSTKPVCIQSRCHHLYWVNTCALEMAGLMDGDVSVEGGIIYKDSQGRPTGILQEFAAMRLIEERLPDFDFSVDEYKLAIMDFCRKYTALGVTLCFDAMPTDNAVAAYQALAEENKLTMRFRAGYMTYNTDPFSQFDAIAQKFASQKKHDLFARNCAKIFGDGIGTMCLYEKPIDADTGFCGNTVWNPNDLAPAFAFLMEKGIQIHIHSIGEGTTHCLLEALKAAVEKSSPVDHRTVITHLCRMNGRDIAPMADMGIIAALQPYWMVGNKKIDSDPPQDPAVAEMTYRFKSLLDADIVVCGSDDYPVDSTPVSPIESMQCAITRHLSKAQIEKYHIHDVEFDRLTPFCSPDERVTLSDMLRCYTINGAYANFLEDRTGSIHQGKSADFVILKDDIFTADVKQIESVRIGSVYFKGSRVYAQD